MRTLQARLIASFVGVTFAALAVAAVVLVVLRREAQEQLELNRVAAISPLVLNEISRSVARGIDQDEANRIVDEGASVTGVRVMLVDEAGNVIADSGRFLAGEDIQVPKPVFAEPIQPGHPATMGGGFRPFMTWKIEGGDLGTGLTFISPAGFFDREGPRGRGDASASQLGVVLAVPNETLSEAWQDLVPALGLSASVALPVAVLLALFVARQVTRPVRELTRATNRLADGAVDVQVPESRQDELGDLARAFNVMARKVGDSQAEMRGMVANVSHDLKTPLTSILGFSQAIRGGTVEGADAVRAGEVIHDEARRLALRLEDILLVAELDAGTVPLQLEPVLVAPLVEGVIARLSSEATASGHEVVATLDGSVVVQADRARLERAIENLLGNAIRHAPPSSRIDISLVSNSASADLAISNPAADLTGEDIPRLFERFYRRDRVRGRASGSGLGLSIARDIAERHHGTLTADLANGRITLQLTLPLGPAESEK